MASMFKCFTLLFAFVFMAGVVLAQEETSEEKKPPKRKSYTEKYKDFYNNYRESYKELYKPGNYTKKYRELHNTGGRGGFGFRNKDGDGDFQSIEDHMYSQGKKRNNLPVSPPSAAPEPAPPRIYFQRPIVPWNPFYIPPNMPPPHLVNPAPEEADAQSEAESLPPTQKTQERPESTADQTVQAASETAPGVMDQETPALDDDQTTAENASPPSVPAPAAPALRSPAQIMFDRGVQSFARRQYLQAERMFSNLVEFSPGSVYAQFAYGLAKFFSMDYIKSLDAFRTSLNLSQQKRVPAPNLRQMRINAYDFRYHYRKLARYVEQNPKDHKASTLLLMLANIVESTPSPGASE
ncbi:MAG: hypothetical protein JXR73_23300 [Candidatus Omnitrophica bacterium]|nr:hypothetical protein [Candidatus Omnitrophota bacterium]